MEGRAWAGVSSEDASAFRTRNCKIRRRRDRDAEFCRRRREAHHPRGRFEDCRRAGDVEGSDKGEGGDLAM